MTKPRSESHSGQGSLSDESSSTHEIAHDRHVPQSSLGVSEETTIQRPAPPSHADTPHRPSRRIARRFFVLLLLAGVAGAGAWYYAHHRPKNDGRLILQGNVDVRQVNLAFKVDGRIETLSVDEGDPVKPGQMLATLDKRYFDDELRLARAGATT